MNLYQLNKEFQEALLASQQGHQDENYAIDTETGELFTVSEYLDKLQMDIDEKLKNCIYVCRNLKSDIASIKAERTRLKAMQDVKEKNLDNLEKYMLANIAPDVKKGGEGVTAYSIRFSEATEAPSDKDQEALAKLPARYVKSVTTLKADKAAIKAALKAGEEIDGCRLVQNRNIKY